MSIPQPGKGQPLDSSYITKIVTAINDLTVKIASKFSNSQIATPQSGKQIARTSDLVVDAGFETISNSTQNASAEVTQSHRFGSTFKYAPVVVATPLIDNAITGKTINVYVKNVTTTSVDIVVKFGTTETASVNVNIVAIGLPSVS